ncbi:hypothetical protein BDW74DRAFT_171223 [Aspergillus multicolor]|uniref:FAD-binding oxidoreductase n=1 Tax=Aspergillus multicolor TaxID=41759 RepID=UPI003CCDEFAB
MTEGGEQLRAVLDFASQHPGITVLTPSSREFDNIRAIYVYPEIVPLAILRPATIEDVGFTVRFLAENKIAFTVRSGGHDMHGRSMKNHTVALDMRLIKHVHINENDSTATIGGGILIGDVISNLQEQGPRTQFGLGVDQIVGANVVNAHGELVEADDKLLKAIRGAGGAFGVLVELTIRVYKTLAGMIMFNSDDLGAVIPQYNQGLRASAAQGLPPALSVQQGVLNAPTPTFTVLFVWSFLDPRQGYEWLNKISSLAPLLASTVQETTSKGWLEAADQHFAKCTRRMWTVSMRGITDEVAEVIADFTKRMPPDPHILFDMHELRACSPLAHPNPESVFTAREPHFTFEINTIVDDEELLEHFDEQTPDKIMPVEYLSFMRGEDVDLADTFGGNRSLLKRLKAEMDPDNVFKAAISHL